MASKSILISGMGIAGCTLAYWLGEHGFCPTLVERAPRPRTGGYVIDFWGRGYDIAERMGLVPALKSDGYDVRELRLVDAHGRHVGGFGVDVFRNLTEGRYVSLPRGDLARMVYRRIEGRYETIFGDSISAIEQTNDSVRVAFEHAAPREFDLVVGADGLHSVVRRLTFGVQGKFEKFLGYAVAAFEVEGYRPRDDGVYVSFSVPGKQISRFAMRDDRTVFLMVFVAERPLRVNPHDFRAQKAVLRAVFDELGWECRKILAALDRCDELYFDNVSQIQLDRWTNGRVALIGDAAACPSLLAGQGAALAMIEAYVLAGELGRSDTIEVGLRRYEHRLMPFLADKQKAAAQFARSFAPKTRAGLFWRNQMTKLMRIPLLARWTLGRGLLDRIELPDYSVG